MPLGRCPHGGAPQAGTARCWVCRRSSTTCSTCRHFRRSIGAEVGYCGLDRRRLPLVGTELRGCWEAGPRRAADAVPAFAPEAGADEVVESPSPALRLRGFIPIELARKQAAATAAEATAAEASSSPPEASPAAVPAGPSPTPTWADRATLFADLDG